MRIFKQKRFFLGVLATLMWLSLVVTGSKALFADASTLTGNTITTGTASLLVSNSQNPSSTIYDHSREGFSFAVNPGQSVDRYFLLKNASVADIPFEVDMMTSLAGGTNPLGSQLALSVVPVDADGNPLQTATEVVGTINALNNQHKLLTGVVINKGTTQRFRLRTSLAAEYATQGDSTNYDLVFTGTQKVN